MGFAIIILGFAVFSIDIYQMWWGESAQKLDDKIKGFKTSVEYQIAKPAPLILLPAYDTLDFTFMDSIQITFESDVIFIGDPVKIKTEAKNVDDSIFLISLIVNDGSWSLNGKSGSEIEFEMERAQQLNRLIDLKPNSDPPFTNEITMEFLIPNEEIHITGVFLSDKPILGYLNVSGDSLTVYSQADKLQVETNVALLKQIEQTKLSNLQQEQTNQFFIGLSIIGIALLPILGGTDLLLRIHLN